MDLDHSSVAAKAPYGRRYCLTIMDYKSQFNVYEHTIKQAALETTGAEPLRVDDLIRPSEDLRPKIHAAIDRAEFVIADISTLSPNVLYEVGYAAGKSRPLILLADVRLEEHDIPIDLRSVEMIRYADSREGTHLLDLALRQCLQSLESSKFRLQSLVLPERPDRSYILANPKLPTKESRFTRHPAETRTFGDYLGVAGLFKAFASFYGDNFAPELLSAAHASDALAEEDANLFLIGSSKVNRFTSIFLRELQRGRSPNWHFLPGQGEESLDDYACELRGEIHKRSFSYLDEEKAEDWGILVRGPHPTFTGRMVLIMAGAGSLGTGGACLAGTTAELVQEIRKLINDDEAFVDRSRVLWVLVKALAGSDGHLDPSNVVVEAAGVHQYGASDA
jgi:nucleoside 2-deoxyribosyltransferase